MNIWEELGIAPTADLREIKRAYAQRLKQTHPEDDPAGFQRLREAFEIAKGHAASTGAGRRPARTATARSAEAATVVDAATAVGEAPAPQPPNPRQIAGAAAEHVIRTLVTHGAQAGVDCLRDVLASEQLIHLEARQWFEVELIQQLTRVTPAPLPLLAVADDVFGWHDPRHPLWSRFGQLLSLAAQAGPALNAYQFLTELADDEEQRRRRLPNWREKMRAARLLLSPWQPYYFHAMSLRGSIVDHVAELLALLRGNFGSSYRLVLDPRTCAFWEEEVQRSRFSLLGLTIFGAIVFLFIGGMLMAATESVLGKKPAEPLAIGVLAVAGLLTFFLYAGGKWLRRLAVPKARAAKAWLTRSLLTLRFEPRYRRCMLAGSVLAVAAVAFVDGAWLPVALSVGYLAIVYWTANVKALLSVFGIGMIYMGIAGASWPIGVSMSPTAMQFHFFGSLVVLGQWLVYNAVRERKRWQLRPLAFGLAALILAGCLATLTFR